MAYNNQYIDFTHLLNDLSELSASEQGELSAYCHEMLALVAYDSVRGVDISKSYPTFYSYLLRCPVLQEAFEDATSLLSINQPQGPTPEPAPKANLSFLNRLRPRIWEDASGQWNALWTVTKERLQGFFQGNAPFSAEPALAFRDAPQVGDDDTTTIIRDQYEIAGQKLEVWLKFVLAADSEELAFQPQLVVHDSSGRALPVGLEAQLEWGMNEAVVDIPVQGRAEFSVIEASTVFNEDDVTAGLKFTLRQK